MKRIAQSAVAIALSAGLMLTGFGSGGLGTGATTNGGASGCCRALA
ncbi:hypothetical protein [Cellulomonas sp. ATA003]|nr:hypothetical protein [Cellulomonas sp. ATA003]WNB84611.1 hypothetical protein REH70_12400 [Cellulomonas sp. ATA003]